MFFRKSRERPPQGPNARQTRRHSLWGAIVAAFPLRGALLAVGAAAWGWLAVRAVAHTQGVLVAADFVKDELKIGSRAWEVVA